MNFIDQFTIQFAGLEAQNYQFNFLIDDEFFSNFEESEIKHGKVVVDIDLEKQARMLILDFGIKGVVSLICDRCLDEFDFPLDTSSRLILKIGSERKEITDEIVMITESDHQINVAQYIYEYIHLALPMKRTHPESGDDATLCNKEIIEKLQKLSRSSIESESQWDALKNLNLN